MEVTPETKSRRIAESILLCMTIIWGGTFSVVKSGLSDISPMAFVAIRFWIASVVFIALFRKKIFQISRPTLIRGCILGIFLFAGFAGQTIGLLLTTASKSGFITGTLVIFTPIAQLIIERRPPTVGNIVGIILVTIGLWIFTSPQGSEFNTGDVLTLAAAVVWGVYIVCLDLFSKKHDSSQLTFIQVGATAVLATVVIPFVEIPFIHYSGNLLVAFLYTALLSTVVTTYAQTRYQKETTPTRAAIIFSLEPIIAAVLAYYFLHESIGSLGILGGTLIIIGLLISELSDTVREYLFRILGRTVKDPES
jgi:drug/metabolite transporter (DMT)-like permease